MEILKRSDRSNPKVSLILLDWNVRESFHFLNYLDNQTASRDEFEVILIEYYSTVSDVAKKHADQIDCWAILQMPDDIYYHKHLMYNAGIILSHGEICVVCDSDAMASPTFIQTIIDEFKKDPNIVLHLDQFRNIRQDFYPFNYPTFEEVLGAGCKNYDNGKTKGLVDKTDPLHNRNYGACMCALRSRLIDIGGADEHIDYLGHICGPYDMTFRLVNKGCREIWHDKEFTLHTWHPGAAGVDNYLGPHDGRHMSSTAIAALTIGQTEPFVINKAIALMRQNIDTKNEILLNNLVDAEYLQDWKEEKLDLMYKQNDTYFSRKQSVGNYYGFRMVKKEGKVAGFIQLQNDKYLEKNFAETNLLADDFPSLKKKIDKILTRKQKSVLHLTRTFIYMVASIRYLHNHVIHRATYLLKSKKRSQPHDEGKNISAKFKKKNKYNSIEKRGWLEKVKRQLKHYHNRIDQFRCETTNICENVERLILFLHTTNYQNQPGLKTILYVDRRSVRIWTELLAKLHVIQRIQVTIINNSDCVFNEFNPRKCSTEKQQRLVSSLLFTRFYPIFSEFIKESQDNVIVI